MKPEEKMALQDVLALNLELQGIVRNIVQGDSSDSIYWRLGQFDRHAQQLRERRIKTL